MSGESYVLADTADSDPLQVENAVQTDCVSFGLDSTSV